MKFWQKVFLSTLVLFLVLLNGSILLLSSVTYQHNLEMEKERITAEERAFAATLHSQFSILENNDSLNEKNILRLMASYSSYYQSEGVYLRLYRDNEQVYCDDTLEFEVAETTQDVVLFTDAEDTPIVCALAAIPDFDSYRLAYFRSVAELEEMWDELQLLFLLVSLGVSALLAIVLMIFVTGMMRPLSRLASAAGEVASGNYEVCLNVRGKDEIAQLTADFNHMTSQIRGHMEQLKEETERKQRFLDNFTHELRTPLTNIYGYSELMMRTKVTESARLRYLQYMMRESNRLNRMSTELFELTVMQKNEVKTEAVAVSELFLGARETLREKAEAKNVSLHFDDSTQRVCGSAALLESLVINLCENAIRACDCGGTVRVSAAEEEGTVALRVQDNGRGMKPEEIAHIMEPFYRVDKARSRADGGVGLGLYLCSEIVRLHHATIQFSSVFGEGTTATVRFAVFTAS